MSSQKTTNTKKSTNKVQSAKAAQPAKGLEGIIAGETAISTVGKAGVGLSYRGYRIEDLTEHSTFEEVAFLLLYGHMPSSKELFSYRQLLVKTPKLPEPLIACLNLLPSDALPMDVMRTMVSFVGCIVSEVSDIAVEDQISQLMVWLTLGLLYWFNTHRDAKVRSHLVSDSIAYNFLFLLQQQAPDELQVAALDASLILYAEHEFNASTFAARVTTATESDLYSAIASGIGTLKGHLHGGANEAALDLILSFATPDIAKQGIMFMLSRREKIMGFGHRVYQDNDPRSAIIKSYANQLALTDEQKNIFSIAVAIEDVIMTEKGLFPNLDFYSALVYHFSDIPKSLFTPLFVLSRIMGWGAHIIEQRANNRLIRPNAEYVGPDIRDYLDIESR